MAQLSPPKTLWQGPKHKSPSSKCQSSPVHTYAHVHTETQRPEGEEGGSKETREAEEADPSSKRTAEAW